MLAVLSGGRKGSYAKRSIDDNERYASLLRNDPELMTRLLTEVTVRLSEELERPSSTAKRLAKNLFRRASIAAGAHPLSVYHALRHRRRGGFIDSLRRTRGLAPLAQEKRTR